MDMRTLDDAWNDALAYLEALPQGRQPRLSLDFWRTDDYRREAMQRNGTPLVHSDCDICVRFLPSDKDFSSLSPEGWGQWNTFKSQFMATAAAAVDDAMNQLRTFLAAQAAADPFS